LSTTPRARLPVHRLHDAEIERLLASGERKPELVELLGADGYRELSLLARRAQTVRLRGSPTVYVLPGLMGSRIGTRGRLLDDVLWLDIVEVAAGHLTRLALPRGARLRALGVMWLNTLKLKLSLQVAGFDARLHAYDWRLGVEPLAALLNARIAADARRDVMLVGHSMGGLVARAALAGGGPHIRRIVQIGAPNGGSFAPVLAMRGVYPTLRKLAALDVRHSAEDLARIVFRTLPSLHELLPAARGTAEPDLFNALHWPDDALRPDAKLLAAALQARGRWPDGNDRCLHVIGIRQETVTGLRRAGGQFEFEITADGDGTVPLALAQLPGSRSWYVAEKHGGLPNNGRVISAVVDLLRTGETQRLPASLKRERGAVSRRVSETALRRVAPQKVRWQNLSADARRRLLEPVVSPEFHGGLPSGAGPKSRARGSARPTGRRRLELRIVHGSIVDANARAIVLGLFRNVDPAGPAAALDARLGGAIRELALRRMFDGSLGQVYVLPTPRTALLAEFAVFAGLGDFDEFGQDAQAYAAENVIRAFARSRVEDFATVLLGAGSGSSVAAALEGQLRGYLAGLRRADPGRVVRRITICELDGRKFTALRRAMSRLSVDLAADDFELVVDEEDTRPSPRPAARPGPTRAPRPVDPVYLLVTLAEDGRSRYTCRASLLTAGAKAAVLSGSVAVDKAELREQVARIELAALAPREFARSGERLARTLLASSVREGLASMATHALVVVHDREASQVPWEALRIDASWPALEQGVSRRYASEQLSVARWREARIAGEKLRVLLVVDPTEDLPGAAAEGAALEPLLDQRGAEIEKLTGAAATRDRLRGLLRSGRFDVLHFAGHGHFDPAKPGESGLVCARDELLRGVDLDGIGDLPALVFFNACEAARVRRRRTSPRRSTRRPSTSLAEAFLVGGVANFLGTHWPVGDEAALMFSTHFYPGLLAGQPLGEAIRDARRAVQAGGSGDWADYVHYGNASFALTHTHP
jgi:CHAT domain-containing protein/pimeloyl-ACP methyl ester carboxylesterase